MPSFVVKPKPDEDFYVYWSTIVEAPVAFGDRDWMKGHLRCDGSDQPEERLVRADKNGTSESRATSSAGTTPNGSTSSKAPSPATGCGSCASGSVRTSKPTSPTSSDHSTEGWAAMSDELERSLQRALDEPMPRELRLQIEALIEPHTINMRIKHVDVMDCIRVAYPVIVDYLDAEKVASDE